MYPVRETKTSRLRARGPVPHALEHFSGAKNLVVAQVKELKDLTIADAKDEQKVQAEAELQALVQTVDHQQERIQHLEEQLQQMKLVMGAEARLCQEAKMQLEHKDSDRAEALLLQDVSNLKEQFQRSQDLLEKLEKKVDQLLSGEFSKDELLRQVTEKLAAKEEEFALLCRTLKGEQGKASSYELSLKVLQEQVNRLSTVRAKMEHRNAALEEQILRLKLEVRRYAEIIVGNEGEPFYEVRLIEGPPAEEGAREDQRETRASEEVPLQKGQETDSECPQTRLSRGQDPDPGRHTPWGTGPNQKPQLYARRG